MSDLPVISCILCHHKGNLILKAIDSLRKSRYVIPDIIVATSDEKSSFEHTKTIYVPGGPARKRNVAFRFSGTDLICFFDDDVEVTPTAIYEMMRTLYRYDAGMVFGKTYNMEFRDIFDEAGSFLTWTGFLYSRGDRTKDIGQCDQDIPILAGKSAACMARRKAFTDVGMFDESYEILGEETDLAWRIWLNGWKVYFSSKSITYHAFNTRYKPIDFYSHQRIYFNGCRNYLAMLTTNLSLRRLSLALPIQIIAWFVSAIGMILRGKFKAGIYILKGIFYYFRYLPIHIQKRLKFHLEKKTVYENEIIPFVMNNPSLTYFLARLFRYLRTGLHG